MNHATHLLGTLALSSAMLMLSCSTKGGPKDSVRADHLQAGISTTLMQKLPSGEALIQFQLVLSRSTLNAYLSPLVRRGAEQGSIVEFDQIAYLDAFDEFSPGMNGHEALLNERVLTILSVHQKAEGDVEVEFEHVHPWPEPSDLAGEATAINRADLGYTGRLVIMANLKEPDLDSHTYDFCPPASPEDPPVPIPVTGATSNPVLEPIVTNPWAVPDADGYVHPETWDDVDAGTGGVQIGEQLGQNTRFTSIGTLRTNTWPYKLLVDEDSQVAGGKRFASATGEPIDILGSDSPETGDGNYEITEDRVGWGFSNIGTPPVNWQGFDYLHGGQGTRNTFTLSKRYLDYNPDGEGVSSTEWRSRVQRSQALPREPSWPSLRLLEDDTLFAVYCDQGSPNHLRFARADGVW